MLASCWHNLVAVAEPFPLLYCQFGGGSYDGNMDGFPDLSCPQEDLVFQIDLPVKLEGCRLPSYFQGVQQTWVNDFLVTTFRDPGPQGI